ncbi:MAG: hypothetical protein J3K34DRAFT_482804 [Monoraphidium minutum]|nr:MAG: hypothetical protein J3K34DRAFT_482804 [Monoraphidium minutum]
MLDWAARFTEPEYQAYASLVRPRGAAPHETKVVELEEVVYDDVMTLVEEPEAPGVRTYRQMRVRVGDTVLVYSQLASDEEPPPPYVARVTGIELAPRREWRGLNAATGGNPAALLRAGTDEDRAWVELQEARGRLPAKYIRLRANYFFRYQELMDRHLSPLPDRGDYAACKEVISKSLAKLGMAPPPRGAGRGARLHDLEGVARYLVYSDFATDGGANAHFGLSAVLNTCRRARRGPARGGRAAELVFAVHYFGRKDSADALLQPPRPLPAAARAAAALSSAAAAAAAGGGAPPAPVARALRPRLPGFVCNLFLRVRAPESEPPLLWLDSSKVDKTAGDAARVEIHALLNASRVELQVRAPAAEPRRGGGERGAAGAKGKPAEERRGSGGGGKHEHKRRAEPAAAAAAPAPEAQHKKQKQQQPQQPKQPQQQQQQPEQPRQPQQPPHQQKQPQQKQPQQPPQPQPPQPQQPQQQLPHQQQKQEQRREHKQEQEQQKPKKHKSQKQEGREQQDRPRQQHTAGKAASLDGGGAAARAGAPAAPTPASPGGRTPGGFNRMLQRVLDTATKSGSAALARSTEEERGGGGGGGGGADGGLEEGEVPGGARAARGGGGGGARLSPRERPAGRGGSGGGAGVRRGSLKAAFAAIPGVYPVGPWSDDDDEEEEEEGEADLDAPLSARMRGHARPSAPKAAADPAPPPAGARGAPPRAPPGGAGAGAPPGTGQRREREARGSDEGPGSGLKKVRRIAG